MSTEIDLRVFGLKLASYSQEAIFFGGDGCAIHDGFAATDYIDLTNSENFILSDGLQTAVGAPIIPDMTSNSSGGMVASASSTYSWSGGGPAWKAFDRDNNTGWLNSASASPVLPGWLKIDTGASTPIGGFSLRSRHTASVTYDGFPVDFELRGSNDNTNWTTIQSYNDLVWTNNEEKLFIVAANYRYYMVYVTDTPTGNVTLNEWQLYPPALTIIAESAGLTAAVQPDTISLVVIADSLPDTVEVGRGVFVPATLTALYEDENGDTVYHAEVDVSATAAGSVIKWRVEHEGAIHIKGIAMWCE